MSQAAHTLPPEIARNLTPTGGLLRSLQLSAQAVDTEARTVTLAFSSEAPYERSFGIEILDHEARSVRQARLRSGANLLVDHNWSDVVGVVESFEIGADRVGRAVVRFGKSARAQEVWQDVVDGIRRSVSVGYLVHDAVPGGKRDGLDVWRVTDWEPYEVSLVSVPADIKVGVGRSAAPGSETPAPVAAQAPQSTPEITTPEGTAMSETATPAAPTAPEQRNHAAEISKIAAALPGGADLALGAIQRGLTVEQFQSEALAKLSSAPIRTADIGLDKKEVKRYSVLRALNALANPQDAGAQQAAAFERECSMAVAGTTGKQARGFMVPTEVQRRDLLTGTPAAGGNLVATDLLSGSFIDILRNAMVLSGLGVRYLTGLVGNISVPKLTGSATAYWVAENTAPTESQQAVGQVQMTPKTVGAWTDIARRLLLQSSIDVEAMVQQDLAMVLGLAIQQAAINGSGASNQPSGLLTQVAPTVIGGANGAAPTWANIVQLESEVAVANADVGTLSYLTNAKVRGKLKTTSKVAGQNGFIWDDGATPLNGYRAAVTNAVPSNLTKGTANGTASALIYGNFADMVIGMWGGLDLTVDPYSGSTAGTVRVVALQDVDVALRNTVSFATMVDALTV